MSDDPTGVDDTVADPAARTYDTVTLLSDLGDADGFVGVLHSIIRQFAPAAGVVDLAHGVDPYDVRGASLLLARSIQYLCPGVIVAAVDPGAGSAQRAVALEVAGGAAVLVGPDNGVLAPGAGMLGGVERAVVLDDPAYHLPTAATTFLARDVLAPAAAHLCAGVPLEALGSSVDPGSLMPGLVPLTSTDATSDGRPQLTTEVLWVDRFGNVMLDVEHEEPARAHVRAFDAPVVHVRLFELERHGEDEPLDFRGADAARTHGRTVRAARHALERDEREQPGATEQETERFGSFHRVLTPAGTRDRRGRCARCSHPTTGRNAARPRRPSRGRRACRRA